MFNIFKITGTAITVICFFIIGEYFACRKALRGDQLTEIGLGIGFLRGDMELNMSPAVISCENISERLREPVKDIFKEFLERLKGGESIDGAWIRALTYNYEKTYLKAEDIEALYPFGKIIECLDIERQDRGMELTVGYIDRKTKELKNELSGARRLYRSLSVLTGLLTAVLLL